MRIAVLGASRVAEHHYLPALAQAGPSEIGILSSDRGRAAELAARFGGAVLPDPASLAEFSPDIVFVLNREENHAGALEAGVSAAIPRIFCEKPLIAHNGQQRIDEGDWARAAAIAQRASSGKSEIAVGFNYRTFRAFRRGLEAAQERAWGSLVSVSTQTHYACLSHALDLMMVLGGATVEVFANEGVWQPPAGTWVAPDRHVVARLQSGSTADLHVSAAGAWEDSLLRLTASYEGGRFTVVDLDQGVELFDHKHGRAEYVQTAKSRDEGYARSFQTSIREYLAAVNAGRPAPTGIDSALRHLQAEAMIVRSIRSGRSVLARDLASSGSGPDSSTGSAVAGYLPERGELA
jgi:predicted dehydrogenase